LFGRKKATGGRVEVFLLREISPGEWECMLRPSGRVREGESLVFEGSRMTAEVRRGERGAQPSVRFSGAGDVMAEADRVGRMPLPPYIKRLLDDPRSRLVDRERYQTVYAAQPGAVAAPTAGLHFSRRLLNDLQEHRIETAFLTLRVGLGTFQPVRRENLEENKLHAEYFEIGEAAAEKINLARRDGRRVVAVGTTTARALESAADEKGAIRPRRGWTDIFIYPPYRFKAVDNLLTNFHLPRSSLIMLVAALLGREKILDLYGIAIREGYRFYSYGDAMLILDE